MPVPIAFVLLLQAAPAAPPPERFSILGPVACPILPDASGNDIVVCATAENAQRLPLPERRSPPDRPMPSNPNIDGKGALAAARTPCATLQGGCQTGMDVFGAGTAAVRLIQKLVAPDSCCEDAGEATNPFKLVGDMAGGIGRAFKRKPDTSNRVAIDLSEPATTAARATP